MLFAEQVIAQKFGADQAIGNAIAALGHKNRPEELPEFKKEGHSINGQCRASQRIVRAVCKVVLFSLHVTV